MITLDDLMAMDGPALHAVMERGHRIPTGDLDGTQYLGVDLSLPGWARKLLWHTFRKTFVRDPVTGDLRGWNVKMQQQGVRGPQEPLTDRRGAPITFGHYVLRDAADVAFPKGFRGPQVLDYGTAGNTFGDVARFGYTPVVAVNEGSADLILGWEVFRLGRTWLPLPLYWAIERQGSLDAVVDPPRS